MAKIRLDLSQFKASGIYTVEFDATDSIVLNTQTTRLVVGFSKKGPINAPVYCPDVKTARRIYGDIDKDLENKGSFFHRSLFTCLETGPCFALSLIKLNDDTDSATVDYDLYKSFSISTTEANGSTANALYSSYYNKERFYFPDTSYFLATVADNEVNVGKLLNFVNLGQTPFSIVLSKTGNLNGFNVTARDWFGAGNVPSYVRDFDYISDYMINVDVISGNWTDFATLSTDPLFSQYFTTSGIIKSKMSSFLNSPYVTRLGSFQGSIIPDLIDNNGVNYSIDTIVNSNIATVGLFCALDREALADYDNTDTTSAGRVDMVGHTLINDNPGTVNFLSYNFTSTEYSDFEQNSTHTVSGNTYTYDVGPSASSNLPGGTGTTGASYSASGNGFLQNLPTKAAYMMSYYGSGNEGKFNNLLVLRKEMFSSTQYTHLTSLLAGTSIVLQNATGATHYGTVSSINEETVSGYTRLKLGISHPYKQSEGTTTNKNGAILAVGATYMMVSGTYARTDINVGDWVYAENSGVRYYFRIGATGSNSSDSMLFIDTTNTEFAGSTNIASISSFGWTAYWESISGGAGSLFDVLGKDSTHVNEITTVGEPDIFNYTSISGQSFYTGYKSSSAYDAFDQGILADGDQLYAVGVYPQPLYVSASFGQDIDAISTVTLKAYRDAELTLGYTGSWTFTGITGSTGSAISPAALRIYSLVGDYSSTVGATGFNSTYTSCYINSTDESKVQVGQFLVADPLNTGTQVDYILTRVISKQKINDVGNTYYGYYKITVNQRLANINSYTGITRYKAVQDVATTYQPTYLSGFKITSNHTPNGSNSRLAEILSMLDPDVSNLSTALSSRHVISFRYIIDTFNGGLAIQSAPKNLITELAMRRQKCMAIMNAPSIQQFINSTDPRFTDAPTQSNPKPLLNSSYIADGGNLSLGPSFTYSLPDEEHGAKFAGFFAPFLMIRENNKTISIPPAADVSNNFIRKFINGQPYSIVAGPRRGVLSNPKLSGLEYDFSDDDRAYLEPMGWNPIVFRRGIGFMIFGNKSAYQKTPSAFNNLHVRDLLVTIEETIEDILSNFLYEFNDSSTRLQIKSIVDAYLDNVRSGGGIGAFKTIMDDTNNTPDIIDQNFAIIDVGIEPAMGAQKFINRITVLKTGGISSGGFTAA